MDDKLLTYLEEELEIEPGFNILSTPRKRKFNIKIKVSDVNQPISIVGIKDYLYNEAISNLLKKSKFLQLYIQLAEDQITEDEYENELETNSDKYFINLKKCNSEYDIMALVLIMQNLPKNLSIDDISEIFGIKHQSLISYLNI